MEDGMNFFKHYVKLVDFEIIQVPEEVKKSARIVILFAFLSTLIPDILAFAIKGAQFALQNGYTAVAILLILLHFGDRILMSIFDTQKTMQRDSYSQLVVNQQTIVVTDVSNTTKSKVFKKNGNIIQMVEDPEVIKITQDYLKAYWELFITLPVTIFQVIVLIGMLTVSIIIEVATSSKMEVLIIASLLIISITLYFILSRKRIRVRREYRKNRKENEAKTEVIFTEIKSTDFISKKDFLFHADKLREKLCENTIINKGEHLKLNKVFIERSFIASFLMVIIMLIKFMTASQITPDTIVDVIALSSIYSMILQRVTSITFNYENFMDMVVELETLYDDFKNINDVYVAEQKKVVINTPIDFLNVFAFEITQDVKGIFELINRNVFTLRSGDTVVAYGKTGCGKSTLIKMLTGRIIIPQNPIRFSNGKEGYLNSIGYQTDKAMANGYSLNEVTLTDSYDEIDLKKLFEILKGLHLYDEFLRMVKEEDNMSETLTNDGKVIEFMKIKKIREFSSGQMQRLALAKLLYSLDETMQLVALDEPFNRLDDTTCKSCMDFIYKYVHRSPRILLIATHQVDICCPYATVKISFDEDMSKSILNVVSTK